MNYLSAHRASVYETKVEKENERPYVAYSNLNKYCQDGQLHLKSIRSSDSKHMRQKAKARAHLNSGDLLGYNGMETISCGGLESAKIVGPQ